ncbi:adenine phosphoribosyltransferase [candidate division BRC1 bacterium HGW-BRC1-1]|jgi:adenine phosphoribosyltransferase|nr:MAG: adenine phosphoribosyltransferase [candidate division BRC1 bacterium HGW-BRC1-1]
MSLDLKNYIRDIPDFPQKGILFRDITPLLGAPEAFRACLDLLVERYRGANLQKIAGIESRGFLFAAPLALELGVGLIPIRKKGKLPSACISETYDLEYGSATIEIHEDALAAGDRVLLLDDLLATGGTLAAACRLVEKLNARVAEVCTVIELTGLNGREVLGDRPFHSFLQY